VAEKISTYCGARSRFWIEHEKKIVAALSAFACLRLRPINTAGVLGNVVG
jgi:hypothetical protein